MINDDKIIRGRGAQHITDNRFNEATYCRDEIEGLDLEPEIEGKTQYLEVFPKSIVNKVDSPDLRLDYSINPYQGCEHGCIYCYARNSHQYWGYEAGMDFESKILYKANAAELLRTFFMKKSWKASPIMLSGNTDCYQPIERKLKITRSLIEIFKEFQNPLGIITKNHLICRDIDLLRPMAEEKLLHVYISLTSLDDKLRSKMEPRTSSSKNRLKAIEELSKAGIPVGVMLAPIIPGLNSHEIPALAKAAAEAGAKAIRHTTVRLNGKIAEIFSNWLEKQFPDRYHKVIHQIQEMHGGKLNDSNYGRRMKGSGEIAKMISNMVKLGEAKHIKKAGLPNYNLDAFRRPGESLRIPGL
ncbi:MAG: radical SAM protein [Flavobacteriales bacterium]|nr:radical SAM protein [Flavobacteriales bacterium]